MAKSLTEDQLDIILRAARPLAEADHAAFLEEVTEALAQCQEVGVGIVYRACREAQRRYWEPPRLDGRTGVPNYSRTGASSRQT